MICHDRVDEDEGYREYRHTEFILHTSLKSHHGSSSIIRAEINMYRSKVRTSTIPYIFFSIGKDAVFQNYRYFNDTFVMSLCYDFFCSTCGGMCFLAATHRENGLIYPINTHYIRCIWG